MGKGYCLLTLNEESCCKMCFSMVPLPFMEDWNKNVPSSPSGLVFIFCHFSLHPGYPGSQHRRSWNVLWFHETGRTKPLICSACARFFPGPHTDHLYACTALARGQPQAEEALASSHPARRRHKWSEQHADGMSAISYHTQNCLFIVGFPQVEVVASKREKCTKLECSKLWGF